MKAGVTAPAFFRFDWDIRSLHKQAAKQWINHDCVFVKRDRGLWCEQLAKPESAPKTELGARIRSVRKALGDPDREAFASLLGLNKNTLAYYERGERIPDAGMIALYRQRFGVDINWMVTGEGAMFNAPTRKPAKSQRDYVSLPFVSVKAAAGEGLIPVDEQEQRGDVVFRRTFLRSLGANPDHCEIISASGDSMYPTIPDGSPMVIDRSKIEIEDDCVYVFRVGEGIKVKRAFWRVDSGLDLVSDNQAAGYPTESYVLDEASSITALARVIFVFHKL